jgi:hypothetical protein
MPLVINQGAIASRHKRAEVVCHLHTLFSRMRLLYLLGHLLVLFMVLREILINDCLLLTVLSIALSKPASSP